MGCAQQVDGLESQFAARMETLKNTVQSKTAVPTAQVYVSMFWMLKITTFDESRWKGRKELKHIEW